MYIFLGKQKQKQIKHSEESGSEVSDNDINIPASLRHQTKYDKKYSCFFCEKLYSAKLGRHLLSAHESEPDVNKILSETIKGSKERKLELIKLEKRGAYKHNLNVISEKKGTLLVMKRPSLGVTVSTMDFKACPVCLGFYHKKTIRTHLKRCSRGKVVTLKEMKEFNTLWRQEQVTKLLMLF